MDEKWIKGRNLHLENLENEKLDAIQMQSLYTIIKKICTTAY